MRLALTYRGFHPHKPTMQLFIRTGRTC